MSAGPNKSLAPKAVILHHGQCPDGVFAAAIAKSSLIERGVSEIRTFGQIYDKEFIPEGIDAQTDVYVLDFSFEEKLMQTLSQSCAKLVVLDHHKTAQDILSKFKGKKGDHICFDMNCCGATLTWDYFHPNADRPLLLTHIEDRDIWTWTHRNSKQFLAGLDLVMGNYTDDMVDIAVKYFHDLFYVHTLSDANTSPVYERLINSGKPLVQQLENTVEEYVNNAFMIQFEGHNIYAVNCPDPLAKSEVGNRLALKTNSFSLSFKVSGPNKVSYSLRAIEGFDASPIAKKYGGGGHAQACAFKSDTTVLAEILAGQRTRPT